jgi:hypothetical protein
MLQSVCGSIFENRIQAGIILDEGDGDTFRGLGSLPSLSIYTGWAIAQTVPRPYLHPWGLHLTVGD